jgi:hypothetical protein
MKISNLETGKFSYYENSFENIKRIYNTINCNNIEIEEGSNCVHFVFRRNSYRSNIISLLIADIESISVSNDCIEFIMESRSKLEIYSDGTINIIII